MQQLTEKELKIIAEHRAFKQNRTMRKGIICFTSLLPFVLLDIWLVSAGYINIGWGYAIFAIIMLTSWIINFRVRKKEINIALGILKELKES